MNFDFDKYLCHGRRRCDNSWINGYYVRRTANTMNGIVYDHYIMHPSGYKCEVDPNTVGLFTGMYDISNKMIFSNSDLSLEIPRPSSSGYVNISGEIEFNADRGMWEVKYMYSGCCASMPLSRSNITQANIRVTGVTYKDDRGGKVTYVE